MGRSLRGTRRAQLYFACLRRLLDAERAGEVNRAALQLLGAVIDTYLPRARELSAGQGARRGVGAYGIRPWSRMRGRLPYAPTIIHEPYVSARHH